VGRLQVAPLDRRISTGTNPGRVSIMLRMMLFGLLIPLGVGALAAMELRTPPRALVTAAQPLAETTADISDSHAALAKADRLEVSYATSATPAQPDPVDEPIAPPEAAIVSPPEAPKIISRHWHAPNIGKVTTAARAKPKPKTTDTKTANIKTTNIKTADIKTTAVKRTAIEHSKAASENESCRLSAFGGLRKALNLSGCEI
jgi:hypothetical protein